MKSKSISFPNDHKSHDAIIEWWYFNGHLKDEEGNVYSFMDCLFKADIEKVNIPYLSKIPFQKFFNKKQDVYFAHAILSDIGKQKNYKEVQNVSLVSNDSFLKENLFVNYIDPILLGGFVNDEIEEIAPDIFHIKTENLDLKLESKKPVLLEGGGGHISVCGRGSYYYSLTDLKTSGTITIQGKKIKVTGKSWMDHQWADTPYKQDKWTWFSLQLNNGIDIMCCEYDDGKIKDYLVDIMEGSQKTKHFNKLILKAGNDIWKSKITKAQYPMSWEIEIPEYDAKFLVKSTMSDQEMIFMAINYWEGPLEVEGIINGKEVKGVGFMELVGYSSDYNYLLTYGKEIRKKLINGLGL